MTNDRSQTGRTELLAIAALIFAALFWSGNFIVGRALGGQIAPLELNLIRWGLCLAMLLPFTVKKLVTHWGDVLASWRLIVLLGATGIAAFHVMVYQALTLTTAVNTLLILALAPVATAIGGSLWNGFRPTGAQIAGLAASGLGAICLAVFGSTGDVAFGDLDSGMLWMLGAVLVWAWYSLLLRKRPTSLPQDVALTASVAVALILMFPVLFLHGAAPVEVTAHNALAVLYIAVFASVLGFLLWSHGVSTLGPERAGQFVHLMPAFGTVLAVVLLDEQLSLIHFGGASLIVTGIILVNRERASRQVNDLHVRAPTR